MQAQMTQVVCKASLLKVPDRLPGSLRAVGPVVVSISRSACERKKVCQVASRVTHLAFSVPAQERREFCGPAIAHEVEETMGVLYKGYSGLWIAGHGVVLAAAPKIPKNTKFFGLPQGQSPPSRGGTLIQDTSSDAS